MKTITRTNKDFSIFISVTIGMCAVLFLLANSVPENSPIWFGNWGYFSELEIYGGDYWGLITSTFLHTDFLHAAFNIYWIWYLGRSLEQHLGTVHMLLFWIAAAIISSGFELALSQDTGLGASGVIYAIFGYQFIARRYVERFAQLLDVNVIRLFIIWLFVCIVLTWTEVWNIANAAHFSGFGFGCLCGWLIEWKQKKRTCFVFALALVVLVIGSLTYAPWSEAWLYTKGSDAYENSNFQKAIYWYEHITADSEYYPYALFWKGTAKDSLGDTAGASVDFERLLKLDTDEYPKDEVLNNLAWTYSTSPDPGIQNYPKALKYASEANERTHGDDPSIIDTLAVAYAANGDFANAVECQKKAIQLSISKGEKDHLVDFQSRLDLYKNGRPYVDTSADTKMEKNKNSEELQENNI